MSIFRFSNAGGFGTYQRYNDFLAGNPTTPVITDFGSMFPLGVFTLSSAQADVTFTNIPQTYQHLQIRSLYNNSSLSNIRIQFNADTGNNYNYHLVYGNGTSALASAASTDKASGYISYQGSTAQFSASVTDILDYRNTSKNTTVRSLAGYDANGSGLVFLSSALWLNTNAISSIRIFPESGGNLAANSSFALYGIK